MPPILVLVSCIPILALPLDVSCLVAVVAAYRL